MEWVDSLQSAKVTHWGDDLDPWAVLQAEIKHPMVESLCLASIVNEQIEKFQEHTGPRVWPHWNRPYYENYVARCLHGKQAAVLRAFQLPPCGATDALLPHHMRQLSWILSTRAAHLSLSAQSLTCSLSHTVHMTEFILSISRGWVFTEEPQAHTVHIIRVSGGQATGKHKPSFRHHISQA